MTGIKGTCDAVKLRASTVRLRHEVHMKRWPVFLATVLICAGAACSTNGNNSSDLGGPHDIGSPEDSSSTPSDLSQISLSVLSLAGGGIGGPGTADDTGATARFNAPRGMAMDGAGNLYVADSLNHAIRKIVSSTGVATTVAGSGGVPGSADGTGTAARFNQPYGVATDGAGNLYVADSNNNTIRQIVISTGVVTTLAGMPGMSGSIDGTGTAARFKQPYGVATDGAGNLYVADSNNNTIRQIVISTGAVTTLAGLAGVIGSTDSTGSAARFFQPYSLTADGAGNLYVADTINCTIRKIVIATGVVTTLAGTAGMCSSTDSTGTSARLYYPEGVALDGAGNLIIADAGNTEIRKLVLSTTVVTTIAGAAGMVGSTDGTGATARFGNPTGVTADSAGNIYTADTTNNTIRKIILSTGAVTTLAGTIGVGNSTDGAGAVARFFQPHGAAADSAGNVYITDTTNCTIRKISAGTGTVSRIAGTVRLPGSADGIDTVAGFNQPQGMTADGAGNLYIADTMNSTIRKLMLSTINVTTLAGMAGMTGSTDGTGSAARFNQPQGVAVDSKGNVYVADTGSSTVRQVVAATGAVTTLAGMVGMTGSTDGTGSTARFNNPAGVAADSAGNLYVADTGNATIRKIVITTGAVTTLAGMAGMTGSTDGTGAAARFNTPSGLAMDPAGNLYVADTGNATVRKISLANATITTLVGVAGQHGVKPGPLPGRLNQPFGITFSPIGGLFIADVAENAVLVAH